MMYVKKDEDKRDGMGWDGKGEGMGREGRKEGRLTVYHFPLTSMSAIIDCNRGKGQEQTSRGLSISSFFLISPPAETHRMTKNNTRSNINAISIR